MLHAKAFAVDLVGKGPPLICTCVALGFAFK